MIYLDANGTTPIDPKVIEEMLNVMQQGPSNPSGIHAYGQKAKNILAKSRRSIAESLGVPQAEITFTSGGTESINLGLRGLLEGQNTGHIISSVVEHRAVLNTLKYLESQGWRVSYLLPGEKGYISLAQVQEAFQEDTRLVALMAVNNETGVKTPDLEEIGNFVQSKGAFFFVDAVAAIGKEVFKIPDSISALAISAHKFHGPMGVGLLVVRSHLPMTSLLHGGGQEYGKRAGTENLPAIAGMAKAFEILDDLLPEASRRMFAMRERFEKELIEALPGTKINGSGPRSSNTVNLSFSNIEGESLLMNLDLAHIAVSHGSACASGALELSHVLQGMRIPKEQAQSSIRFSISRVTTDQELEKARDIVISVIKEMQGLV